jgi:predicted TIM-barrel enzyme
LRKRIAIEGFYRASFMERLPTEVAITELVRVFSRLQLSR